MNGLQRKECGHVVVVNESGIRHEFVEQLLLSLSAKRLNVELVSLDVPGDIHGWLDRNSSSRITWFASPKTRSVLRHLVRKREDFFTFALGHKAGVVADANRMLRRRPYAFSFVHQTNFFSLMQSRSKGWTRIRSATHSGMERKYLRDAEWIQSVSADSKERLLADGINGSQIHDIPLGVDFAKFAGDETVSVVGPLTGSVQSDAPYIVSVGRLAPEKNHLLTLEAFAIFAPQRPEFHLVILGEGPLRQELEDRVDALDLSDRVHLLGFVKEPGIYLRSAQLFTHASLAEAYASVQLEARLSDVPIVSSRCGVALDMALSNDPMVTLVDSDDPSDWAQAWLHRLTQRGGDGQVDPKTLYKSHDLRQVVADLTSAIAENACR